MALGDAREQKGHRTGNSGEIRNSRGRTDTNALLQGWVSMDKYIQPSSLLGRVAGHVLHGEVQQALVHGPGEVRRTEVAGLQQRADAANTHTNVGQRRAQVTGL